MNASAYINKVRVVSETKNTKVGYPANIANSTQPLISTIGCLPNFTNTTYTKICNCKLIK